MCKSGVVFYVPIDIYEVNFTVYNNFAQFDPPISQMSRVLNSSVEHT